MREIEAIHEIAKSILTKVNLQKILNFAVEKVAILVDCEGSAINLLTPDRNKRYYAAGYGNAKKLVGQERPLEKGIQGFIITSGEPVLINDIKRDNRITKEIAEEIGLKNLVGVPLRVENQIIGCLTALNKREGKEFTQQDLELLSLFGDQIAIAIENTKLVEEIKDMYEKMLTFQKFEIISAFSSGIVHDLNNVLMIIEGSLYLCLQNLNNPEEVKKHIAKIQESISYIAPLIRKLLLMGKGRPLQKEKLNLNNLIEELKNLINSFIPKSIKVVYELEKNLWDIEADKSSMEQVILNLVLNSKDAIEKEGEIIVKTENKILKGVVEDIFEKIRFENPVRFVTLMVKDTGKGIKKELIPKIFEPFFTTKEKGTGLGLSLIYSILKNHNGFCTIESQEGRGTTFYVYLPAVD